MNFRINLIDRCLIGIFQLLRYFFSFLFVFIFCLVYKKYCLSIKCPIHEIYNLRNSLSFLLSYFSYYINSLFVMFFQLFHCSNAYGPNGSTLFTFSLSRRNLRKKYFVDKNLLIG